MLKILVNSTQNTRGHYDVYSDVEAVGVEIALAEADLKRCKKHMFHQRHDR